MCKIGKSLALVLISLMVMLCASLSLVQPSSAQSISTPSVPEFSLKFVDNSYYVPTTTTTAIDPYTGKQVVTTQEGYYVQNDSIEIIIKNQPFTPYADASGNSINLYFNFSTKGHFSDNWTYPVYPNFGNYCLSAPNSQYTILTFGVNGNNGSEPFKGGDILDQTGGTIAEVGEVGGQVDFRVMAFIGYSTTVPSGTPDVLNHNTIPTYQLYTGQESEWSGTQTVSIPSSTQTSGVSEFPIISILSIILFLILIAAVFKHRQKR